MLQVTMLHYHSVISDLSLLFAVLALPVAVIFRGGVSSNDREVKVVLQRERIVVSCVVSKVLLSLYYVAVLGQPGKFLYIEEDWTRPE